MSLHRTKTLLAACVLIALTAVPALGQGLQQAELFASGEMSTYGGGPRPSEGFFFVFDGLCWWIESPDRTTIGLPGATRTVVVFAHDPPALDPLNPVKVPEANTHDTGVLTSDLTGGQRYDLGYVSGHWGWLFSGFTLFDQNQEIVSSNVSMVFQDPPFGPAPPSQHLQGYIDTALTVVDDLSVTFTEVDIRNTVETWGAEMNWLYRTHPYPRGGILELYLGARYLELDERFDVDALGGNLGDSVWNTSAENHIVGPQVGGRWFRKQGRWTWSTEARFFAGFNSQNFHQRGTLGAQLDPTLAGLLQIRNMGPTSFNHTAHASEWSPAGELRVDLKYQLTSAISVRVGWTGLWIDGIARASNAINYEVPRMGLDLANNRQEVFVNGLNVGVELNH